MLNIKVKFTNLFFVSLFFLINTCYASVMTQKEICEFNGINYQKAINSANSFREAIRSDDKEVLSQMIVYPLRVNKTTYKGKNIYFYIKNKQEFISQFYSIFTDQIKTSLFNDKEVFCNYMGAATGGGAIWFYPSDDKKAEIFVVNVTVLSQLIH